MRTNFLIYDVRSAMRTNDRRYLCPIRDAYEVLRKVLCLILMCTKFAQKHAYETARKFWRFQVQIGHTMITERLDYRGKSAGSAGSAVFAGSS
jgi:hypothetical protein